MPSLATSCHARLLVKDVDENRHPPVFDEIALEASVYGKQEMGKVTGKGVRKWKKGYHR